MKPSKLSVSVWGKLFGDDLHLSRTKEVHRVSCGFDSVTRLRRYKGGVRIAAVQLSLPACQLNVIFNSPQPTHMLPNPYSTG